MSLYNASEAVNEQIVEVTDLIKEVFGEDALGLYLYGSILLGGLQKYSDIDLLAITQQPTTSEQRQKLIKSLLAISATYPPTGERRSIELTVVVQSELKPWSYPPHMDFQYGDWMREDFEGGKIDLSGNTANADIAIIATQVLLAGESLIGPSASALIDNVPYKDFMAATASEIQDLLPELKDDTRNVLLTLARIWHTLDTDAISSKQVVARWALTKLPQEYQPVFEHALAVCLGDIEENWDGLPGELIQSCAKYLVDKIEAAKANLSYDSTKRITVSAE